MTKPIVRSTLVAVLLLSALALGACSKNADNTSSGTGTSSTSSSTQEQATTPSSTPSSPATATAVYGQPDFPVADVTELQIQDIKVGTGAEAKSGSKITVDYTGWLTDGTKFDSSLDRGTPLPLTVGVGQVIPGWDQGLLGMKVGGQRRLIIPPAMAYGAVGNGSIPPNATLVFDVELKSIL